VAECTFAPRTNRAKNEAILIRRELDEIAHKRNSSAGLSPAREASGGRNPPLHLGRHGQVQSASPAPSPGQERRLPEAGRPKSGNHTHAAAAACANTGPAEPGSETGGPLRTDRAGAQPDQAIGGLHRGAKTLRLDAEMPSSSPGSVDGIGSPGRGRGRSRAGQAAAGADAWAAGHAEEQPDADTSIGAGQRLYEEAMRLIERQRSAATESAKV
jgi:hypothetical protein